MYITVNTRPDSAWVTGECDNLYHYEAKVFLEPSKYGINEGRVSKLIIQDLRGKEVVIYDRCWVIKPTVEVYEVFRAIYREMEELYL